MGKVGLLPLQDVRLLGNLCLISRSLLNVKRFFSVKTDKMTILKLLRGTPSRYKIPQAPRLMKSAPNVQRYSLIRAHIEPFARIVSFKSPSERKNEFFYLS